MSRSFNDINAKIAYITNKKNGPILKIKDPLKLRNVLPRSPFKNEESPCKMQLDMLLQCIDQHNDNSKCAESFAAFVNCSKKNQALNAEEEKQLKAGERVKGRYHPNVWMSLLHKHPDCHNAKAFRIQRNLLNTFPPSRIKEVPFRDTGRPFNKR